MSEPFRSFAEFWPHYLAQHRHPVSRALHYVGSSLSVLLFFCAAVAREPWLLLGAPVVGYAFAWTGHFAFEKNKPATFGHPLWSLRGDFMMLTLAVRGRIRDEVARLEAAGTKS